MTITYPADRAGRASRAVKAKICGLTTLDITRRVVKCGPDHIGFVFAPSRRQVLPLEVNHWLKTLKAEGAALPGTVGVFVQPTRQALQEVLDAAPLDAVQFNAEHDPSLLEWVKSKYNVGVWVTVPIGSGSHAEQDGKDPVMPEMGIIRQIPFIDVILLDTHHPAQGGGSGKTFDWNVIPSYQELLRNCGLPLYVAGGLGPENVASLLARHQVHGVDVSSGVETNGTKDIDKVASFIERVSHHDN
ncbi:phosphoribosylanthranilate isomerase [Paenibacillus apiarius]|uniref:N-(5'-phosphoribosyl)anthranilate isomerase n=1 Tax=Paenibacillus apiarius TaxID=46240 RepID=A0ABT4DSA3_9BACL|nr:phosphoribosylanthranilate isomerase [Paenibacillus apiarius]MCY9517104.1 phosphoribosylanthranilate isomerase [Paenibacillus apiarius]MCY9520199.1 phosphoribosylanthranilate isomerase [Paenibacillus apiarius]MCY9554913.1 phosphoribosylanthranilate isomerase [Paenibacillus apiarius]MCY9561424.1 phosphoribosylanthranilate isomerase [Paenibacillus apiarius]MCY9685946.1 phosphoribosylanthranilate isomerase [Paenibacillus apiarius]